MWECLWVVVRTQRPAFSRCSTFRQSFHLLAHAGNLKMLGGQATASLISCSRSRIVVGYSRTVNRSFGAVCNGTEGSSSRVFGLFRWYERVIQPKLMRVVRHPICAGEALLWLFQITAITLVRRNRSRVTATTIMMPIMMSSTWVGNTGMDTAVLEHLHDQAANQGTHDSPFTAAQAAACRSRLPL